MFICFVLVLTAAMVFQVKAAAIKVTPPSFKIEVVFGNSIQKEFIVENPSQDTALYEVYPDDFVSWIRLSPASFILESKAKKSVLMEIEARELGIFSTNISFLAKPLAESRFKTNSGIKAPLEIRVKEEERDALGLQAFIAGILNQQISVKALVVFSAVFVLLLCLTLFLFRSILKRKQKNGKIKKH